MGKFCNFGELLKKVTVTSENTDRWKQNKSMVSFTYKLWYDLLEHNRSLRVSDKVIDDLKDNHSYTTESCVYANLEKIKELKLAYPTGMKINWNYCKSIWEAKNILECNKSETLLSLIQSNENIKPVSAGVTKLLSESLNLSNKKTIKLLEGLVNNIIQEDETLTPIKDDFKTWLDRLDKALKGESDD